MAVRIISSRATHSGTAGNSFNPTQQRQSCPNHNPILCVNTAKYVIFWSLKTFFLCRESIAEILRSDYTEGILCDIGLPVLHKGVRYNCRIFLLNRRIILIRPKLFLANDGNYREMRWFTGWQRIYELDEHQVPQSIRAITGQRFVPFGVGIIVSDDTTIASETCEELFTPNSPHIQAALNGAEIIANGSGSHHQLRKLEIRLDLLRNATTKSGGAYLYANQQGCDGQRLYYDGCANIHMNGELLAQGSQFSVYDVEVITAVVDLEDIRSYRSAIASRSTQAASAPVLPTVRIDFRITERRMGFPLGVASVHALTDPNVQSAHRKASEEAAQQVHTGLAERLVPSVPIVAKIHSAEEEIALGPACWLWDYLRRSGASGYFLPLSGGADSSATAAIVGSMCQLVVKAVAAGDQQTILDARRVAGEGKDSNYMPQDAAEFAHRLFHSCYMGTGNSSEETRARAAALQGEIGGYHLDINIDAMISAVLSVFQQLTGKRPQYKVYGGTVTENLALQNLQARLRMVFAYMCAQLLPWCRGKKGFLLVLGSANVDESLRGYMTKFDCSAADVNPIGGIAKGDLKRFLVWGAKNLGYAALESVVAAKPTAELEPITSDYTQTDEEDMGMSYEELGIYGRLRKIYRCGPVSMYEKLQQVWGKTRQLAPTVVAKKVKDFFYYYSVNRHKLTVLTPSYHAENYSPEDNRFDHRQFLYNNSWTRQFTDIDALAQIDQLIYDQHAVSSNNQLANQQNPVENQLSSADYQRAAVKAEKIARENARNNNTAEQRANSGPSILGLGSENLDRKNPQSLL
jgi:NAD+ synthase (glutamine-hydrolysing)